MRALSLSLVAVFAASMLSAQEPAPPSTPPAGRQEEMFRVIDVYLWTQMQERLALSDDQFVKVLPLVKKLQNDRRGFEQHRVRVLRDLRRTLASGEATEARIAEMLKEIKGVEGEMPTVLHKDLEALDAVLTPIQQAKYRVLESEVEQRIRELIRRAGPRAGAGLGTQQRWRRGQQP